MPTPGSGPPTAGGEWPGFGARVPSTWLEGQGPIRNLGGIHRALCPGVRATTTERTRAGAHRGGGSMPVGSSGCAYVCAFRGGTRVVHPSSRTDVSFSPRGQGRCPSAHGCRFRPLASLPCRRRQCCVLGGGGWPDARLCWCLQPAAPIGLSPFYRCPSHEPFASTGGGAHRPLTPSGPPSPSLAWGGGRALEHPVEANHWPVLRVRVSPPMVVSRSHTSLFVVVVGGGDALEGGVGSPPAPSRAPSLCNGI